MKKILLLLAAPFAFISALSAQVSQEEAEEIVLERMSQATQSYNVYAKDSLQTEMTITTINGEELELDYPCWVYYISYIRETDDNAGCYLIVNESNGNLLEIKAKKEICPPWSRCYDPRWKRIVIGYDCDKDELSYYGNFYDSNDKKTFLDGRFLNNCLLVGYPKQVQGTEIIDYLNQTGLFNPVDTSDLQALPNHAYIDFSALIVYTKENKTCSQLKEIIHTLEKADIIAFASLTAGKSDEPDWTYTDEIAVGVKDKDDLSDLYAVMEETNTRIKKQTEIYYLLGVGKNSMGNAVQVANYFYETGKFKYAHPNFLTYAVPF